MIQLLVQGDSIKQDIKIINKYIVTNKVDTDSKLFTGFLHSTLTGFYWIRASNKCFDPISLPKRDQRQLYQ